MITANIIENIWKEKMDPENIKCNMNQVISKTYKGTCADITELDEEELGSSMYNSQCPIQKNEVNIDEHKNIEIVDNNVHPNLSDANNKESDNNRDNTVTAQNEVSYTAKHRLESVTCEGKNGQGFSDDDKPTIEFDQTEKNCGEIKSMSDDFDALDVDKKLIPNNENEYDSYSQEMFEENGTNKKSIKNSIKKLTQVISSRNRNKNISLNFKKSIKPHFDQKGCSFSKQNGKTPHNTEFIRNFTPSNLNSKSKPKNKFYDKKLGGYLTDLKARNRISETARPKYDHRSNSLTSCDLLDNVKYLK